MNVTLVTQFFELDPRREASVGAPPPSQANTKPHQLHDLNTSQLFPPFLSAAGAWAQVTLHIFPEYNSSLCSGEILWQHKSDHISALHKTILLPTVKIPNKVPKALMLCSLSISAARVHIVALSYSLSSSRSDNFLGPESWHPPPYPLQADCFLWNILLALPLFHLLSEFSSPVNLHSPLLHSHNSCTSVS